MQTHLKKENNCQGIEPSEFEAVMAKMDEGVVVVGSDEAILCINDAAKKILLLEQKEKRNNSFLKEIGNKNLRNLVLDVLQFEEALEEEIVLQDKDREKVFVHVKGVLVSNEKKDKQKVLIVINDVTKLRLLENIRSEFVANVSHELKTPITTIKGFVETLLDGGIDDAYELKNFLGIVLKNADRLNSIVEDLLTLSRIEEEDSNAEIVIAEERVVRPLVSAIEACSMRATEKNVQIVLKCSSEIMAPINSPLLEQAVSNLIVNAIKYSDKSSRVYVRATEETVRTIAIEVEDFGTGIHKKHLPRLFERFYRSDKARSRKLGGTGLGLAIVKHIVMAHHGRVGVQSEEGKGTKFTIRLPRQKFGSEELLVQEQGQPTPKRRITDLRVGQASSKKVHSLKIATQV